MQPFGPNYVMIPKMGNESEKDLIRRAQKDPEAFGELYEQNYVRIFGYILRRIANIELAQDITSETFCKAFDKLGQFRWRNVPFSAWLYRIAGNEVANHYRQNGHHPIPLDEIREPTTIIDPPAEMIEAQDELSQHQDFLHLQGKIARLPIKYQEVMALRYFEEKKVSEIADILGKREGTVKSLLSRALEKLRNSMD